MPLVDATASRFNQFFFAVQCFASGAVTVGMLFTYRALPLLMGQPGHGDQR